MKSYMLLGLALAVLIGPGLAQNTERGSAEVFNNLQKRNDSQYKGIWNG
jgi:hypothetical protein